MHEISCEICMDLIPLVQDGAASEDSCRAVEAHVASCPQCRAVFTGQPPAQVHIKPMVAKMQRKLRCLFVLFLFLGIFFGTSIAQLSGAFSIIFIMPIIGMLAYGVYRWKALWLVPLLLLAMYSLSQILLILRHVIDFNPLECLLWAVLTIVFSDVGVLIAGLFHFGLRKEKHDDEEASGT